MIRSACLAGLAFAFVAGEVQVNAQTLWLLSYKGTETTAESPEDATRLITRRVTEKDLIERAAADGGVSTSNLVLVLHENAESLGDRIEVVNRTDPNLFRRDVVKLFFSEGYTNDAGTFSRRFQYVYTESEHSRGSAIVTRRTTNKNGAEGADISGDIQFWGTSTNGTVLSTGAFKSKGPLVNENNP